MDLGPHQRGREGSRGLVPLPYHPHHFRSIPKPPPVALPKMSKRERERLKYHTIWEQVRQDLERLPEPLTETEKPLLLAQMKHVCAAERSRALRLGVPLVIFTPLDWLHILKRYHYRCAYCRRYSMRLTQDHIVPLSKGGYHHKSNIIPACRRCNAIKHTRPASQFKPLILPW